jgi:hypothetical protein
MATRLRGSMSVLSAALLVLLQGCCVLPPCLYGPPRTTPGVLPGPPICEPRPTRELSAAIFATYYHAYRLGWRPAGIADSAVPIMDLTRASEILRDAPSPEADAKRRRAIGILVAAGTPPSTANGAWQPIEIDTALRTINAPMAALAEAFLAAGHLDIAGNSEQARANKRWLALRVLDSDIGGGPWRGKCCSCLEEYDVDEGPTGMAWFRIKVERPLADIRKVIDPQTWDCCLPERFEDAYLLEDDQCTDVAPQPACPTAPSKPDEDTSPPAVGTAWGCRVLYEHFQTTVNVLGIPRTTYSRNQLQLEAWETDVAYLVDYGLCQSIDGSSDGTSCSPDGLDADCGYAAASPSTAGKPSGPTRLDGVKFLGFTDATLDVMLDPILRQLMEATAEEGVCCGISEPAGKCPECLQPIVNEKFVPTTRLCSSVVCS